MKNERFESLTDNSVRPEDADVAARVYADETLWPAFEKALYPGAEPTESERQSIQKVVAAHCAGAAARRRAELRAFVSTRFARIAGGVDDFALAAARAGARGATDGEKEESSEPVSFVFVSDRSDGCATRRLQWRAEMTLPAHASVDEMLPISLTTVGGAPVVEGLFKVAGATLPIQAGRAEIPYGLFLSGLKDAEVELVDAQGVRSPGTLVLF